MIKMNPSSTIFVIATCLLVSAIGMGIHGTVYDRNGQVCEVCADGYSSVPYRNQGGSAQRVVHRTEGRVISSRPSANYVNRDEYYSPQEACHPSPCGINTKCEVINSTPTCSCLRGYVGNALNGCKHECESDHECGSQEYCKDFKCQQSCAQCGISANCLRVSNHNAICECPKNYYGDPRIECRAECYGDRDCPSSKPACYYGVCKNPCDGACGIGANCDLKGLTPVCSCPRDMTGDPFVSCRPFTKEDLCSPNPCGSNAQCVPGHDNTGRERPVCTCIPGYTGNPLNYCVRGECQSDGECSDSRACINYSCVDPCVGQCGSGAICEARRHLAICRCPNSYIGDALVSCRQSRSYPVAKYYKKK